MYIVFLCWDFNNVLTFIYHYYKTFEIFTDVKLWIVAFLYVTSCSLVIINVSPERIASNSRVKVT
jgi:hypothetical protein